MTVLGWKLLPIFLSVSLVAMEVKIFNVGQGNCTVVKHPTLETLLVDAGTSAFSSAMKNTSVSKPTAMNQKRSAIVDYAKRGNRPVVVVVSHGDRDHYSWIPKIIESLRQKNIQVSLVLGGIPSDYVSENNNPTLESLVALRATLGGKFASECTEEQLQSLTPGYCSVLLALTQKDDKPNKRSIVLRIDPLNMILPGDADSTTTSALLRKFPKLKAPFFLAAHHGTDTDYCNDETFLEALSPQVIFVSAGCSKGTKHPTGKFVQRALKLLCAKQRNVPHTITFHPKGMSLDTTHCKPFLSYDSGYVSAITCNALYGTIDMDDITIKSIDGKLHLLYSSTIRDEIVRKYPNNQHAQYRSCMMKSISTSPLKGLTKIDLSSSEITDENLLSLDQIESTVQECVLDGNPLTQKGIVHVISLFKSHRHSVSLSLNKIAFVVRHLEHSLRTNTLINSLLYQWSFRSVTGVSNKPLLQRRIRTVLMAKGTDARTKQPKYGFYLPEYFIPDRLSVVYKPEGYLSALGGDKE